MLPGPGFRSGSVLLLPAYSQKHHQADLLLQPGRQSLGTRLPEVSVLRFRLVQEDDVTTELIWFQVNFQVCPLSSLHLLLQWPLRRSVPLVLVTNTRLQLLNSTRESANRRGAAELCW